MIRRFSAAFLSFLLAAGLATAGGPLTITGPAATNPGQAFVWSVTTPIKYTVDSGPLSVNPSGVTVISNAQGLTRVQNLFNNWQNVPTTSISFSYAGPITGVSGGHVKTLADFNTVQGSCNAGTQSPVIFDGNASLLKALGGDSLTIGFTSACKLDMQSGKIQSALILMNGKFQDGIENSASQNYELTADQFDEAITHEMGHFSGLDHSQINDYLYVTNSINNCDADGLAGLPLMFPISFCQSKKSAGLPILAPDDVAWISSLYPSASYSSSYAKISGYIYYSDGITQVQGVNVIARRVDDPGTVQDESRMVAFSAVSGFEFTGNPGQSISGTNTGGSKLGSRNPALIGYYEIPVTPGSYTIQIESVNGDFIGGSSVGPLSPPAPLPAAAEYWHQYQSPVDDPAKKDVVVVQAGSNIHNLNFILNGTAPRFDGNESGMLPAQLLQFPLLYCQRRKLLSRGLLA